VNRFILWLALVLLSTSIACSSSKPVPAEPEKHYPMIGEIKALDSKEQTATIQHQAIGDWMGAMKMEYPVRSKDEFAKLHVGDKITATVNVQGGDYNISDIHKQPAP